MRIGASAMHGMMRTAYGLMMLDAGHADGLVAGVRQDYPATIRPALQIIGVRESPIA